MKHEDEVPASPRFPLTVRHDDVIVVLPCYAWLCSAWKREPFFSPSLLASCSCQNADDTIPWSKRKKREVPEFFCKENDWDIYYQLIKEMRDCQADHLKKSYRVLFQTTIIRLSKSAADIKFTFYVFHLCSKNTRAEAVLFQRSEWIPWHEGAHLLSQNPTGSRTFQRVIDKCAEYSTSCKVVWTAHVL